jgi:polysaccharide pyruvyl transferase WcaK-like protein
MRNLISLCTDHKLRVTSALAIGPHFDDQLRDALPDCDVVLINGEGTMHHDRLGAMALTRAGLLARQIGKPVALLNTVWESNRAANALLSCVSTIYAREPRSAAEIAQVASPVLVVPDLSLADASSAAFDATAKRRGGVLVLDDVRLKACLLLAAYAKARKYTFRCMDFPSWKTTHWREQTRLCLARIGQWPVRLHRAQGIHDADVVVTGRFHGVCLAILAGTPFVALSSNTHKIEGLLDDARLGAGGLLLTDDLLASDPFGKLDAAVSALQALRRDGAAFDLYQQACHVYLERAHVDQNAMFARLADWAVRCKETAERCSA